MLNIRALIAKILDTLPRLTNDSIKTVKNISLNSSGAISAGSTCAVISTNVSGHIPAGYRLAFAVLRGTQNGAAVCWYFEFFPDAKTVDYRLRNVGSSTITTSPTANLLLIKKGNNI